MSYLCEQVLNAELQQLGLPKENSDGISRPFRIHRDRLRSQAACDSLRLPRLLSLDWAVEAVVGTTTIGPIKQHLSSGSTAAHAAAAAGIADPVYRLRLGLSHSLDGRPPRVRAQDASASQLLLSTTRPGMAADPAMVALGIVPFGAGSAAAATPAAAKLGQGPSASDDSVQQVQQHTHEAVRPAQHVSFTASAEQFAALIAELRVARRVLSAVSAAAGSGSKQS